ncbi:MAG: NAD(P)H-quinone oxidoreductase subunit F [Spirulinaceae cyanobacterium RM2_2_10]|nr:NAD(P)H-quinone oxidoreductase subunit F [Spirulinaceae cyanobacterium SM2_1_0]NJO18837.1 NAD(P)H-quinone oxidoreductase subunit F [Spirulinaceae cyanobacterium RM2_2_10]
MSSLFSQTAWLIPCYALLGAVLALPWSPGFIRRTGPRPAGYVNVIMTFLAFLHSILALIEVWGRSPQLLSVTWLQAADLTITLDLKVSAVTAGAAILITGLNLLAQVYAIGYLEMDWGWARFYSLLALFEAGMCALVLINSLFFSYVVLEVLTLGTYLLIGYWFNQSLVVTGARDAFLTKRVGDLILLMGVVALRPLAGTWNFDELADWATTADLQPWVATLLGLALLAGPLAKCAQFPLHLWLDEAMEGPVPATILRNTVVVSTGAWVLIKVQPILALSPIGIDAAIFVGAVTAIGASLIAIAQIDIKRVLSYATSAYMGLIFVTVGTSQSEVALTLLLTYAIAMSLLIMSTGGIVLNNISQDVTQYGGLWSRRPVSGLCYLVGAASLVALPPLGSFWPLAQLADNLASDYIWLLGVLLTVNALTAFSMMRVFGLLFLGEPTPMTRRSPEGLWALVLPMVGLTGFALHIPLLLAVLDLLPGRVIALSLPALALLGSTLLGAGAGLVPYGLKRDQVPVKLSSPALQDFFAYDLYTAKLYKGTIVFVVAAVSNVIYWIDRFIVDGVVNLVGLATMFSGQTLRYNTSGQTQFYVFSILLGIAALGIFACYPLLQDLSLIAAP